MEDKVYRKLNNTEKELLATLFETESMRAILKAGAIYQEEKAEHIALMAYTFDNVLVNRGNIVGARFIYDLCKYISKKEKEKEKRNQLKNQKA